MIELRRDICSHVPLAARLTDGQTKCWARAFPRYGLHTCDGVLDWELAVGLPVPRVLYFRFARGDSSDELA